MSAWEEYHLRSEAGELPPLRLTIMQKAQIWIEGGICTDLEAAKWFGVDCGEWSEIEWDDAEDELERGGM